MRGNKDESGAKSVAKHGRISRESATAKEFLQMADLLVDKGFRLGPKIGEGSYARVRVLERQKDGKIMAVKIVNRRKAVPDYLTRFLPRELQILCKIDHKNIINVHEVIHGDDHIYVIMDYAERGDLLDHIRRNGAIPDFEAKRMFSQLADAVKYLHDMNVAHRDLKCENVLMKKDYSIVLSDFGFSRSVIAETGESILSKTFCGSAAYASPELLRGIPYNPKMNDVWSLGCVCYIMLTGSMPYDDTNVKKMIQKQLMEKIGFPSCVADKVQPSCKNLIRQMLEPDTGKRLSVGQVLSSEWVKST